MNKKEKTKENLCAFYANDNHFEMISLPYIAKNIEENKEIVILTENNLEETTKNILSISNMEKDKKEKILKLNWKNEDLNKFKQIKANNEKDMIIFIKGKTNYIKNINNNITKWISKENNIKIIDCYDFEENAKNIETVVKKYNTILKTNGENKINK